MLFAPSVALSQHGSCAFSTRDNALSRELAPLFCVWRVSRYRIRGSIDSSDPPMCLVDYVVAHELVHLRHDDHSRAFWSVLGRVMPDYESRREDLRQLRARLEW